MFTRNLLESVNHLLNKEIITEGKKDSLKQIQRLFDKIEIPEQMQEKYLVRIEMIHKNFKRADIIQFLVNKVKEMVNNDFNQPSTEVVRSGDISHFISFYNRINQNKLVAGVLEREYRFNPKATLKDTIEEIEDVIQKQKRFVEAQKDDEIFIDFHDGFVWMLLPRAYCELEGDAMGHCGNTAAYQEGDRILSLRKKIEVKGQTLYEPHATFIWKKDGKIGERKGIKNRKPEKNLEKYIFELLMYDEIKGLQINDSEPQGDFQLSDLSPANFEKLINKKTDGGWLSVDDIKHFPAEKFKEMFLKHIYNPHHDRYKFKETPNAYEFHSLKSFSPLFALDYFMGTSDSYEHITEWIGNEFSNEDELPDDFLDAVMEKMFKEIMKYTSDYMDTCMIIETDINNVYHFGLDIFKDHENVDLNDTLLFFTDVQKFFQLAFDSSEGIDWITMMYQALDEIDIEDYKDVVNESTDRLKYYEGSCVDSFDEDGDTVNNLPYQDVSEFALNEEDYVEIDKEKFYANVGGNIPEVQDAIYFQDMKNDIFILYDDMKDVHHFFI